MAFRTGEKPKRIQLKGAGRHEEALAGGTIKPGMLVILNSSNRVVVHATSGGYAEAAFALEDALKGKTIDDNYSNGDLVSYTIANKGDSIYALLAAGETAVIGSKLVSNGDGTLQVLAGAEIPLAICTEAQNLADSGEAVAGRVKCRIV